MSSKSENTRRTTPAKPTTRPVRSPRPKDTPGTSHLQATPAAAPRAMKRPVGPLNSRSRSAESPGDSGVPQPIISTSFSVSKTRGHATVFRGRRRLLGRLLHKPIVWRRCSVIVTSTRQSLIALISSLLVIPGDRAPGRSLALGVTPAWWRSSTGPLSSEPLIRPRSWLTPGPCPRGCCGR